MLSALHLTAFHPALVALILATLLMVPVCMIIAVVSGARVLTSSTGVPAPVLESTAVSISVSTETPLPTLTPSSIPTKIYTNTPTLTFTPTKTFTPTLTFTPSATPTITLPAAQGANCVPDENERVVARVVSVTDGDTIVVDIGGTQYKLRYIGIDAPESSATGGKQSTDYNRQLVEGKTVTLVKDHSETDRYDRLLRYVFVGDTFVNYEMVRAGFATSGSWPPDTACDQVFATAEQSARLNQLGLWVPTITPVLYIPPAAISTSSGIISGSGSNCDPSYPDVCIPRYPPDLDCSQIPYRRFRVIPPDPHSFDRDGDGIGCEGG